MPVHLPPGSRVEDSTLTVHSSHLSSSPSLLFLSTLLTFLNRITRASSNSSRRRRRSTTQGITSGTGDVIALFFPSFFFSFFLILRWPTKKTPLYLFVRPTLFILCQECIQWGTVATSLHIIGCWAHNPIPLLSLSPYNVYYLLLIID